MPEEITLDEALGGAQLPADAGQLEAEIQNKTEEFKEAPAAPEEAKEPETPVIKKDIWEGLELPEEEKTFWNKKASIEAREKYANTLREQNKLRAQPAKVESYYDNERAYMLDQNYLNSIREEQEAETLEAHWAEQQTLAENGEKVRPLHPVLDKDGNPTGRYQVGDATIEPTDKVKSQINKLLFDARVKSREAEKQSQSIRESYKNKTGQIKSKIESARKGSFAHWQEPANAAARKQVESIVREQTGTDDGNPLFPLLVDAVSEIVLLHSQIKTKQAPKPEPKPSTEGVTRSRDPQKDADKWKEALESGDESILRA